MNTLFKSRMFVQVELDLSVKVSVLLEKVGQKKVGPFSVSCNVSIVQTMKAVIYHSISSCRKEGEKLAMYYNFTQIQASTELPYSFKFLWDNIFVNFVINLGITKILFTKLVVTRWPI